MIFISRNRITASKAVNSRGQVWWLTSIILATSEAKIGELEFETGLNKKLVRPYLKNN
jgi:hypothetical protein